MIFLRGSRELKITYGIPVEKKREDKYESEKKEKDEPHEDGRTGVLYFARRSPVHYVCSDVLDPGVFIHLYFCYPKIRSEYRDLRFSAGYFL